MRQPSPANTATSNQDRGIASNKFQQQTVGVVVDEVEAIFVEGSAKVRLGDGKTDGAGDTLTKRTGGELDAIRMASFRVTRGQGIELTELLEIVQGELVAQKVKEGVLQRTTIRESIGSTRATPRTN